jgi:hypothetical protein
MSKTVSPEIFAIYFSGFSAHAIEVEGAVYPTLEHAYHCLRYDDPRIIKEIRSTRSPELAWAVSQKYKASRLPKFSQEPEKLMLMESLIRAKFEQHEDVRRALRETREAEIVKKITTGPPGDGFWDIGDGTGANHVGKIWMKLRSELLQ